MRPNQNASLIAFEEMYSSLISKNYIFQSFTYDDDDLCDCFHIMKQQVGLFLYNV